MSDDPLAKGRGTCSNKQIQSNPVISVQPVYLYWDFIKYVQILDFEPNYYHILILSF